MRSPSFCALQTQRLDGLSRQLSIIFSQIFALASYQNNEQTHSHSPLLISKHRPEKNWKEEATKTHTQAHQKSCHFGGIPRAPLSNRHSLIHSLALLLPIRLLWLINAQLGQQQQQQPFVECSGSAQWSVPRVSFRALVCPLNLISPASFLNELVSIIDAFKVQKKDKLDGKEGATAKADVG